MMPDLSRAAIERETDRRAAHNRRWIPKESIKKVRELRDLLGELVSNPAVAEGTFAGDVVRAIPYPFRRPLWPEAERSAAVSRLAPSRPVRRETWPFVRDALAEQAGDQEPTEVLRHATTQSVLIALAPFLDMPIGELERQFKTELAELLCEELLGPSWRHQYESRPGRPRQSLDADLAVALENLALEKTSPADIEGEILADDLLREAQLTPRETVVWEAHLAGLSAREIADESDPPVSVNTVSVHLHNARKKLQAAAFKIAL